MHFPRWGRWSPADGEGVFLGSLAQFIVRFRLVRKCRYGSALTCGIVMGSFRWLWDYGKMMVYIAPHMSIIPRGGFSGAGGKLLDLSLNGGWVWNMNGRLKQPFLLGCDWCDNFWGWFPICVRSTPLLWYYLHLRLWWWSSYLEGDILA